MFEFELFVLIVMFFVFMYAKSRIDELKDQLNNLQARLNLGVREPATEPEPVLPETGEIVPALSGGSPEMAIEQKPAVAVGILETPPTIEEKPAMAFEQAPVAAVTEKRDSSEDLEFKVGSKIFTAVGVIAVICAVGFFLRYAFEVNLINRLGRVVLGVVAGLVLLAVGELTRKKFPGYGQALTGGGLGVLYLSFFAAFSFYQLMPLPVAFAAMIMVTAAGILLSLRQNSMALAMFAQIGGFLTPMLVNDGSNNPHVLFLYVALLDLAVFLIAFYKLWQPLSIVCFAGTVLSYVGWYAGFYTSPQFVLAQGYLSLFFAIFLCIPFIQYFVKKSPENSWDMALVSFNPMFYFAMSYAIINPLYHGIMGLFTFMLGVFYCFLAAVVGGKNERESLFRHFLLTAGFVLLAIAVPVQFGGKWMVAAWSAEALAYIIVGFKMKFPLYRALGHLLFFVTLFRLLFFEVSTPYLAMPIFNIRLLAYAIFFLSVVGAIYLYRKRKADLGDDEKSLIPVLELGASFILLFGLSFEVHDFFDSYLYPILWSVGGLAAALLSFKLGSKALRAVTYITFAGSFFRLLFFEGKLPVDVMPIFNIRLLAYAVFFLAIAGLIFIYRQRKSQLGESERSMISVLELAGAFIGLLGLSLEIHDFFGTYLYPMLWAAGGLAAALLSFKLGSKAMRAVTYITFAAAFFRLLGFENNVDVVAYMPLFNTRVLAFVFCAAAFRGYLSLLRWHKDKVSADEYGFFQPALFIAFHFLILWVVSAEIISLCDRQTLLEGRNAAFDFENLKNVLLSVAWTVYGIGLLVLGFVRKAVYDRFLGIALFAVVIFKVFLIDTANLSNLYRFFSFITLGCLLLLAGYLYYRYQDRIRKFVKGQ